MLEPRINLQVDLFLKQVREGEGEEKEKVQIYPYHFLKGLEGNFVFAEEVGVGWEVTFFLRKETTLEVDQF